MTPVELEKLILQALDDAARAKDLLAKTLAKIKPWTGCGVRSDAPA